MMSERDTFDALIVGAGPAGGTAARLLAQAGRRVAVVEQAAFPRRKVCGEFLSAASLRVLDDARLAQSWRVSAGPQVLRVAVYAGKATPEAPMPRGKGAIADGFGRALSRELLDAMLLNAAREAGAEVLQPARVVGLERRPDGAFEATVESRGASTRLRAHAAIAAHGSWVPGPLPSQPGKTPSRPGDLLAFKAHFKGARLPEGLMPLLAFPGGYGGMVEAEAGRTSISLCLRRDVLEARRARDGSRAADAAFAHVREHCLGVREALDGATLDGPWLAAGPIRPGIRPRYQGGVFRVGNAAGEAHPVVAEGVGMAMQGGWLLARCLLEHSPERAEDAAPSYARLWHEQFAFRIHAALAYATIASRPVLAVPTAALLRTAPPLVSLGARLSGKVKPLPA